MDFHQGLAESDQLLAANSPFKRYVLVALVPSPMTDPNGIFIHFIPTLMVDFYGNFCVNIAYMDRMGKRKFWA